MISSQYNNIRAVYLTAALFGWRCGKTTFEENDFDQMDCINLTISGVQNKLNCSFELFKMMEESSHMMFWKCEIQPELEVFTKAMKARFAWSCFEQIPVDEKASSFKGMGLVLFSDSKDFNPNPRVRKVEWLGQIYLIVLGEFSQSPDEMKHYFGGFQKYSNRNSEEEDIFENESPIFNSKSSQNKQKKSIKGQNKKRIQVSSSEWWRRPRILSGTRQYRQREASRKCEKTKSRREYKRKQRFWKRVLSEYENFQNLSAVRQSRVFRESFLPCLNENFGSFDKFMDLLSHTNVYKRWRKNKIQHIRKEAIQKAARKLNSKNQSENNNNEDSDAAENHVSSLLLSRMSLSQYNKNCLWSKRKCNKTGKMRSIRVFSTVLVRKLPFYRSWAPIIGRMKKYFTEHERKFKEMTEWKNQGKYLKSNESLIFLKHLQF